ncbi:MAG: LacI family transcriptional regulator, partial [Mesorhizobium sp.]
DRRNETWVDVKKKHSGISEVAMFGTLDNPIANSVANQARSVLQAHPDIKVMFAPYDEFAKGVKIAVDEAGLNKGIKIYSADISTSDIAAMR